jgi:hypothetical protein
VLSQRGIQPLGGAAGVRDVALLLEPRQGISQGSLDAGKIAGGETDVSLV